VLAFTPSDRLTDAQGRPYFLWDCDLTLEQFRAGLDDPDPEVRAYLVGKIMRQAKPDDVFLFVRPGVIRELWPRLVRYLGSTREFWTWLFDTFDAIEPPEHVVVDGATIAVDSRAEMLAGKLATLLERSEVRDLLDVKALLDAGGDLQAALRDAPKKDAGFSPLALAWVLRGFEPLPAARALGWSREAAESLVAFRDWLIGQLTAGSAPESE
jgi:hypothetical protein